MSDHEDIPADVRSLVARHIDSVVQLELLLLFHRDASTVWTADDAARELRVEQNWTATQLQLLAKRGLLREVDTGADGPRFAAADAGAIARLSTLYADRRVSLIALIYSKQTDTLRTFADAFRIRKEGNRDG